MLALCLGPFPSPQGGWDARQAVRDANVARDALRGQDLMRDHLHGIFAAIRVPGPLVALPVDGDRYASERTGRVAVRLPSR